MKSRYENRIELLQGTLDLLILQTLQWGPQHGYGIEQPEGQNISTDGSRQEAFSGRTLHLGATDGSDSGHFESGGIGV